MERTDNIFSEVYNILLALGDNYISRIPAKVLQTIKNARNMQYSPMIYKDKSIDQQNVSKDAIDMIALLHINYWCYSEEEKNKLYNILKENEKKENQRLLKNIFNS